MFHHLHQRDVITGEARLLNSNLIIFKAIWNLFPLSTGDVEHPGYHKVKDLNNNLAAPIGGDEGLEEDEDEDEADNNDQAVAPPLIQEVRNDLH